MARRDDASIRRLGAITLVCLLIVMAAAFNLQRFPGFRGKGFHADFADASGLARGDMVQIAGVRVGNVTGIRIRADHVRVDFDVHDASFGRDTRAAVKVLNLLGSKYLELFPEGSGSLAEGATIPRERTEAGYDIVSTLSDLTVTTEKIDTDRLAQAFTTLSGAIDSAAPEVQGAFSGIERVSKAIAARDADLQQLLAHADSVTRLLAERKTDLVVLMRQGNQVLVELRNRRDAIRALLVNAKRLSDALTAVVDDNQARIGPVLADLQTVVDVLRQREKSIGETIHNLAPYARILINVLGSGPWFDAYVPNLVGLASGEFVPGKR